MNIHEALFRLFSARNKLEIENARLLAEVERLRAALKPFAEIADTVIDMEKTAMANGATKYYFMYVQDGQNPKFLTADEFRKAVKALKGGEG